MQNSERSARSSRKIVPDQLVSPGPESQSDSGQYMCIECSETFDTRLELNSHRQSHVIKKQFTCTHCGRGFHHQVFLQMHERSHEDGAPARTSASRVISTRSSKMSDVVHVRPTYTKPQRLLNSIVEFNNEQKVCQTFAPKEFVTRLSHGTTSPVSQVRDSLEKKNLFELRISKLSDTTVHLMDSFGNSIEILADVFNTYTIGEPEENGVNTNVDQALTKTCEKNPSEEINPESLTEEPSDPPQTKPTKPALHASEMNSSLPPSHDLVTSESIALEKLYTDDASLPLPAPANLETAAALKQKQMENQPSSETETASAKNLQPSGVSQENVNHIQAADSGITSNLPVYIEDHMDTSPEDAAAPLEPQNESGSLLETAKRSSTLITPTAEGPIGGTDSHDKRLVENPSIIALPVELSSKNKDQSLLDEPGTLKDAACGIPNKENEQLDEFAEEMIADDNQDLTLLKPDTEIGQVLIPPPEKQGDLSGNLSAYSSLLESSVHEQSGKGDVDLCNTLLINRDDVSLPTENKSTDRRSAQEPGAPNEEATFTLPASAEHSERIGVDTVRPEKHDLQSVSIQENVEKNINLEADICMTSQDVREVCISEGDVCSPERNLEVDNKDPEKPCSLLAGQDILQDDELVIDDKRDDDLFARDIFPLEAPMEVCEKSLASIEEDQNIVCGREAHSTKIVQEKESDICLNGSDMTYISESEMIKLLEQDKDDIADDEPITNQKDLENIGLSQKDGVRAFSEPELSNDTKETKSSRSPVNWDGGRNTVDGRLTSKHSGLPASLEEDTVEVQNDQLKLKMTDHVSLPSQDHDFSNVPTFQATPKQKVDTDSCLPVSVPTNNELRTGDIEPQDPIESMLPQDSVSKTSSKQLGFTKVPSGTNFQLMKKQGNPDMPHPCGNQNYVSGGSSLGNREVNSVGDSTLSGREHTCEHVTPEENIDIFVTVEDECDDYEVQQMDSLESPLLKDAVIESVCTATVSSIEPKQTKTLACVSDTLPPPQKEISEPKLVPKHGVETEETICNQERYLKNANVDQEMENPPLDILDYMQSTSGDDGDHTNVASLETTDFKNEGMQEQDTIFPLKKNETYLENNAVETDICTQEQTTDLSSDLDHSSLSTTKNVESMENDLDRNLALKGTQTNKVGELPTANIDVGGLEDGSTVKDVEKPTVASSRAINDDIASKLLGDNAAKQVSNVISSVGQDSVQDSLEDLELIENDHQEDADIETLSKPMGAGGECLKCGRKVRRGRKELVWLPVCFKCRLAAKRKERLSNQEIADGLDLGLEPLVSRREERLSAESSDSCIKQDICDEPISTLDSVAVDEKEALGSAPKKMYKCPKCDEAFRIPALLAGHIKCHTLPQCLTCGCQMRLKYKTKRIPRRCQKCFQQLKEKMKAEKKVEEGSGDDSGTSDEDVVVSLADVNPDVSDEDSSVKKAKRKSFKSVKPGTSDPSGHDDASALSPEDHAEKSLGDEERDSYKKDQGTSKKQENESSDELDISDQNLGLPDGEKPRLCPQCGKALRCNRSLNLHLLSHTGMQCESCGCRLLKRRRVGRWSKKCRGCRLQIKAKLMNDGRDEIGLSSDKIPKQKNIASLKLKAKQSKVVKNTKIQSIVKKKKELKWMNMLLAVKGLMDKSRKKRENALQAADAAKKDRENSKAEKCDVSSVDNTSICPDHSKSDPHYPAMQEAGSSQLACPPIKALSGTPKQGRKCLYREKNIIKMEENEGLPYITTSAGSISTAFIKQEEMWQCLECNQSWPNSEALVNHQHSHISGQSFTCPQCPQVFSSEQYLNIHVHAHDEERPFRCPECDKTFTRRNHLGVHMRAHTGSRPFACPDCPCRFRQKVTLIAHRYSHRNYQLMFSKPFQCSVCSKSFKQKERLVVHERLHTGECPFSCKDCDKVFPSKARLYVHRKMHKICEASSSSEQNVSSREVLEGQPFKCQDCGKVCSTKASFVLHRKVHRLSSIPVQSIKREKNEDMQPFSCRDCNKVFSCKASLAMHLKNHSAHKATVKSDMNPDLKECFLCKVCDKVFSTKASLAVHRKIHKSPSAGEENLALKVESGTPSYICKHCNKVCSTKASLVLHCRVHKTPVGTETPPFRCKDCDVVCSTKAKFVLHRKVHRASSSNRQSLKAEARQQFYNCKHCDMVCSTKASFVLHNKVHKSRSISEKNLRAGAEPQLYTCKHCHMVCSTKASFVLHNKLHRSFGGEKSPKTSEEPQSYNCKHCDMVCSTKASFVLHSKVHRSLLLSEQSSKAAEASQSYSCKECDMVCSTKARFVLHSKVHRGGQNLRANTEENPFTCKDCNKVCSTKASFVLHRKVHKSSSSEHGLSPKGEGAEPFSCKDCGKIFSSKGRLSAHSKVHEDSSSPDQNSGNESDAEKPKKMSEEKPFSCTICDLRFTKLKMLVRHKAVHGERTVTPCIHCGKRFLYMKSLFNHMKICQSKSKGKKPKKVTAKRKIPKDGGSTSSDGDTVQKKRKIDKKQKALTAALKLKNKSLTAKAKKAVKEKGKGKGTSDPKTKEKRAKGDSELGSEGEGRKTATEKQSDGRQEKPSEPTAKEPALKKSVTKVKKVKKEPAKDKKQKVRGPKKWRVLATSTVKKKNLQAILIGGKKKLLMKKKVQLKPKSGGKAGKD